MDLFKAGKVYDARTLLCVCRAYTIFDHFIFPELCKFHKLRTICFKKVAAATKRILNFYIIDFLIENVQRPCSPIAER